MNSKEIKKLIKKECEKHGITFLHVKENYVLCDGIKTNGYFDQENRVLAISTTKNWLETLIHEYCHLLQYLRQDEAWTDCDDAWHMWEWLDGMNCHKRTLNKSIKAWHRLELECEMAAVELHKQWNTGINTEEYIQKANAYTLFYFYIGECRKWYQIGREPYSVKEVWASMPKTFDYNHPVVYDKVKPLFSLCV